MFTQIRSPSKLQTFQKFNSPTFEIINVSHLVQFFFFASVFHTVNPNILPNLCKWIHPFFTCSICQIHLFFLLMTMAATCIHPDGTVSEPRQRKPSLCIYAKTKVQISCMVTAFVFATLIVQPLFSLNLKFQVSSHILWLYLV